MIGYSGYTHHKPSGIDWLGDVPAHWQVIRIKHLTPVKRGASPRPIDDPKYFDDEGEFAWVRIADVSASDRYLENTTQRLSEIGENLSVKRWPGDLFLSIAGTVGKPIITSIKCCIHDGFVYFPDFKQNNEFLYYIFACGQPYLGLGKMGTQLNLNTDTVGSILIGLPPAEEQEEIVKFLDFKTAQIDALIAKQKTLLDKLSEKRTALISHAVTKGLDPSVPMRDSGVEWLGEIPAHWDIWKVTHGFGKIGSGTTPKSDNPLFYDGEIPWVTTSELRESVIFDTAQKVTGEAVAMHSALKVYPAGSLAIAMYGATIGRLGILGVDATFNQACCVFSDPLVFDTQFVYYWLWMRRPILISLSNGGGQPNLSQDDLKKLWIPIPDLNEQRGIVRFLDIKTSVVDEQVKKVEEVIARLSEYRSALITNAVTGKIDVRDFPIPDPVTKELCDA